MLDGSEVFVGDNVHDILLGTGRVVSVTPEGGFVVRYSVSGNTVTFRAEGLTPSGQKRIFWRNPITFIPTKDNAEQERLINAITETVTEHYRTAGGGE